MRQQVDDLFGESVAEVLVLLVGGHVGEREHGDRRKFAIGSGLDCSSAARDVRRSSTSKEGASINVFV